MALKKTSLGLILAMAATGILLTITASGVLNSTSTLSSLGSVTQVQTSINIGVYSDSACTQSASALDWGALSPGDSTTRTVYIKNIGTGSATLSLTTNSWSPANVNQWINLTWNKESTSLAPNAIIQATLTLAVSASIDSSITAYSFNIQITGTGT